MQSLAFQEVFHHHPTDSELELYCRKSATTPESVDDDEFQKFEGHLLVCDACVERAKSFEVKLKTLPKVRTAGGSPLY